MNILIVTPLYPPDIAGAAPYVKELATRLREEHAVTILAYNHIPESIDTVRIIPVQKSTPLFVRLFTFLRVLIHEMRTADVIIVENGPSVELPFFIAHSIVRKKRTIFHVGDATAFHHTEMSRWYRIPFILTRRCADRVLIHEDTLTTPVHASASITVCPKPHTRPEILSFETYPTEAFNAYETSWNAHITLLTTFFTP